MAGLVVFIILLMMSQFFFEEIAPLLLELLWYAIKFLAIAIGIALKFAGKGLLWVVIRTGKGMIWVCVRAGRGIHFAVLLLYFVIDEKRRGPAFEDEPEEDQEDEDTEPAYEAALKLFGLSHGISKARFKRAYIEAIKRAHPDKGGSARRAQELNVARDLVMSWNGWT